MFDNPLSTKTEQKSTKKYTEKAEMQFAISPNTSFSMKQKSVHCLIEWCKKIEFKKNKDLSLV